MSGPSLTVDIVLIAGTDVLLVQRGGEPFAGAWALPGGFVDAGERVADAASRELREETGIDAPSLSLFGVWDTPGRDPRGPTVSIVWSGRADGRSQPRGGDDASDARWWALDALPELAFDHAQILGVARERIAAGEL